MVSSEDFDNMKRNWDSIVKLDLEQGNDKEKWLLKNMALIRRMKNREAIQEATVPI